MRKALQQLNSKPVILLENIGRVGCEKCSEKRSEPKLLAIVVNPESGDMHQNIIVTKSSDSDQSAGSLKLKMTRKGGVPSCLKRKVSLEESLSEADTAYKKTRKSKKDDSDPNETRTVCRMRSKQHQLKEKSLLDKKSKSYEASEEEKDDQKKKINKLKMTKSVEHSEIVASSLSSKQLSKHNSKKERNQENKSKENSERSLFLEKIGKSASKHSSSHASNADGRKQSDAEALTEDLSGKPEKEPAATAEDEDLCDVPRSDSAATVTVNIDDRPTVASEPDFVNLLFPEKSSTLCEYTALASQLTESIPNVPLGPLLDDSKEKQTIDNEAKSIDDPIEPSGDKCIDSLSDDRKNSETNVDAGIASALQKDVILNQEELEKDELSDDNQSEKISDFVFCEIADVSSISNNEENEEMECGNDLLESSIHSQVGERAKIKTQLSQLSETTEKDKATSACIAAVKCSSPTVTDSPASTLLPQVDVPVDEKTTQETITKKMSCISLEVSSDELEKQESDIREEKQEILSAISEIAAERCNLNKELHLLQCKSQDLEQDLKSKNSFMSESVHLAETLFTEVNKALGERNRFLAETKKTQNALLETEINLRQLQFQFIRQNLEVNETKLVETHPLFNGIGENQRQVEELTEQVANKSSVHQTTEAAYQKAEKRFRQKNEEHDTLCKSLEEARQNCQKLRVDLKKITSDMDSTMLKLKILESLRKKKLLRLIELDDESTKIEMSKKLQNNECKRRTIIAEEEDGICEPSIQRSSFMESSTVEAAQSHSNELIEETHTPFPAETTLVLDEIPSRVSPSTLSTGMTPATFGSASVPHESPAWNNAVIRMVDSLSANPGSIQASTSQNVIPASFAHTFHPNPLLSSTDAMPLCDPFINSKIVNVKQEITLYQDIVNGGLHRKTYNCAQCGLEAHQKCSRCRTTFYCSRECQVAHWDEHGTACSKQV